MPKTTLGRWSVALNAFFVVVIAVSIVLVKVLGVLDFGDHWWDVTVPITFSASIAALITGILAVRKSKDRSVLVYVSIVLGICVVLFIPLHSLFISD